MIRLAISVEGRTEEEFVKNLLAEHLRARGVESYPILLNGNVTVERVASEMAKLIWNFDRVTSLVDFYGFRDKGIATLDELKQCIAQRIDENMMGHSWDQSRAFPYIQQNEFEGLLFSKVNAFEDAINAPKECVAVLQGIRLQFPTPEDINDNSETAPSKRIKNAFPRYHKAVAGPLIAKATGLDVIRAECPRFNKWVTRMESLGN